MLLNCGVGEDSWESWTTGRSNQSILKEISPEYSLEGLMLKMKLQYSGHLMWRTDSVEKTLMLGKIEGRRSREWQRVRWLDGITNSIETHVTAQKCWMFLRNLNIKLWYGPSIFLLGIYSREFKNICSHKTFYMNIHSNIWLLSFRIMFSRFSHAIPFILLYCLTIFHCMSILYFT